MIGTHWSVSSLKSNSNFDVVFKPCLPGCNGCSEAGTLSARMSVNKVLEANCSLKVNQESLMNPATSPFPSHCLPSSLQRYLAARFISGWVKEVRTFVCICVYLANAQVYAVRDFYSRNPPPLHLHHPPLVFFFLRPVNSSKTYWLVFWHFIFSSPLLPIYSHVIVAWHEPTS